MHHPAADVQRRADDAIGLEPFNRKYRTDDVDDRVEGAHLVQVDLLDRNLVNCSFGLAKTMEERFGPRLRVGRERRPFNELVDFGKASMGMLMRDGRGRVGVRVFVIVSMGVSCMVPVLVLVFVCVLAVFLDDEFGRRHTRTQHARRRHRGAVDGQAAERTPQLFERQTRVEQRAEHHVARSAVEAVEI